MKYKKTTIDKIIQTLTETGDRRTAWEAGNISEETFYQWMKKPEFSECILEAEKQWRDKLPQAMRRQAQKAFEDYLYGRVVETWTTIDGDRTIVKKVNRGVPQWAIERVLGKPMDLFDAINVLVREQVLPFEFLDSVSGELESCAEGIQNILSGAKDGDRSRDGSTGA